MLEVLGLWQFCGTCVSSRTNYGMGWCRTKENAKAMAFDNDPNCRLVLAECE
ncbi:hypothetical protein [Methylobacterium dankookense]|uniref:Uncharacterized protein n=1 Tax=Methylobacterium dankookense TaxID=560405 RepID=A0A564FUS2_9HYPH|nr:hypothetical protein [Methylobacterium dankookense]GJD59304.1 hypothetical protein IFDJLNFL_5232 [Methylobacterium dankookense]VUF11895.1 hypothetical protein MTDSW087_01580 [Methylobacterium dankookense]